MTQHNPLNSGRPKILTARRLALLASAAGLAVAVVVGGPAAYRSVDFAPVSAAQAADAVSPTGFADLVAKVKPAVISVRVRIEESANTTGMGFSEGSNANPFPPGSPMHEFFQQFGFQGLPNGMPQAKQIITGEGSGFFISPDGYAVTNNHVVDHAKNVQIKTDDGTTYQAKVIGTDPKTDLALIKVDADKTFPYVQIR